jgi:hypothetical protein
VGAPCRRRAAGHVVGVVGVGEPCRAMVLTSAPRGRDNWGRQSTHVCPRQLALPRGVQGKLAVGWSGWLCTLHCIALLLVLVKNSYSVYSASISPLL